MSLENLGSLDSAVWRMIHPVYQDEPFSGEGAQRYGGRWNMKGWPTLYLSTGVTTAVDEYYRGSSRPGMLVPYHVQASQIANLTGFEPEVTKAVTCAWRDIARRDGEVPPSWAIAQRLIADGVDGALVPSTQNPGGINLVLWRWHDAREPGEGAALTLLDPDAAFNPRLRSG